MQRAPGKNVSSVSRCWRRWRSRPFAVRVSVKRMIVLTISAKRILIGRAALYRCGAFAFLANVDRAVSASTVVKRPMTFPRSTTTVEPYLCSAM